MAQARKIKASPIPGDEKILFFCPGCGHAHVVDSRWSFNGDYNKPTFRPSVLVIGEKRCHSFVTDGKIQFLNDCSHELAGQTVDLPEVGD